jgi:chromosome segregation ATPase
VKEKEAAAKAFHAEKAGLINQLEDLKKKVEEIRADKETAEGATREKDAHASKLRSELEDLQASMSRLQLCCDDLDTKRSRLHDEKNSVAKALDAEKAEAAKLRLKIEELENCSGKKDGDIRKLKVALDEKKGTIDTLSKEIELLQLAVAEAQKKGGIWTWLYAATTTMVAAISFIYATRSN